MPDATLDDFNQLVGKVYVGDFPILPQPAWGQDAALLAFMIDGMRAQIDSLKAQIAELFEIKKRGSLQWRLKEFIDLELETELSDRRHAREDRSQTL
jgi:hypothetical protein